MTNDTRRGQTPAAPPSKPVTPGTTATAPAADLAERRPTAFDAAIAVAPDAATKARLMELRAQFTITQNSPEWQFFAVIGELIAPLIARVSAHTAQAKADAEAIVAVKAQLERLNTTASIIASTRFVARAPAAAALYFAALVVAVATATAATWGVTRTYDAIRYAAATPAVAQLLETPGGRAAAMLLRANGDALPQELARCKPYTSSGRRAITCDLFADGLQTTTIDPPLQRVLAAIASFPAWPLVAIATLIVLATAIITRVRKGTA